MTRTIRALRIGLLGSAALWLFSGPTSAEPISAAVMSIGAFLTGGSFLAGVVNTGIGIALNFGLSLLGGALTEKPKGLSGSQAQVEIGADAPRRIIIGRGLTGGRFTYWKGTGKKNGTVHLVFALSDWECDALEQVFVDGVRRGLTSTAVTGTEDARYTVNGTNGKMVIRWFAGAEGQSADSTLVTAAADTAGGGIGEWTTNHRLDGICYAVVQVTYDDEDMPRIPEVLFQVRGAKLYDWRLDDTAGGSGAHRWNDPSTWEWSGNPAVADYNFRRGFYRNGYRILGMGVPASDLLTDLYTAAANVCDETVTEGGADEARYTVGVIVPDNAEFRVACDAFRVAMAGDVVERAGQFGVIAGASYTPVMTISDSDLLDSHSVNFSAKVPRSDLYNAVAVTYANPTLRWDSDSLTPLTNGTYESEDADERLIRDVDLASVYKPYQARRIGKIIHYQSRMQATFSGVFPSRFRVLEPGDWVTVTFDRLGFGIYTMKVTGVQRVAKGEYQITFRQCASANFTAPGGSITLPGTPTITPPDQEPDAPLSLTASDDQFKAILLNWTVTSVRAQDTFEVWEADSNDRSMATKVAEMRSTSYLRAALPANEDRWYWIRAVGLNGVVSDWYPSGATSGVQGSTVDVTADTSGLFTAGIDVVDTLPAAGTPDRIVLLTTDGLFYVDNGTSWDVQSARYIATRIVAANLQAISANMGTLTAGKIESPNFVTGESGFQIDASTGEAEFQSITVGGGTSTKRPFRTIFGTEQDGLTSDEGMCQVNLPKTLTGHSWLNLTGTAKRTPTGVEYNLTASYNSQPDQVITGTYPRGNGMAWAPAMRYLYEDHAALSYALYKAVRIDELGDIYAVGAGSNNAYFEETLIASFLNEADQDPFFRGGPYNQTVVWVWKDVLLKGIRRVRVPETVLVAGTPTAVTGVRVWMWGAASQRHAEKQGSPGGYVKFDHAVDPDEILSLLVGGHDGHGFGGCSPMYVDDLNYIQSGVMDGQGGGGSFLWRGAARRANLMGVAGGGGGPGTQRGSPGGGASSGGTSSGTDMVRCVGFTGMATRGEVSGGGGYEGGVADVNGANSGGAGGSNYIVGTATSTTNSGTSENGSKEPTASTPPGTAEQVYIDHAAYDLGRADAGTSTTTHDKAGPGLIALQWLT